MLLSARQNKAQDNEVPIGEKVIWHVESNLHGVLAQSTGCALGGMLRREEAAPFGGILGCHALALRGRLWRAVESLNYFLECHEAASIRVALRFEMQCQGLGPLPTCTSLPAVGDGLVEDWLQ